jgi:deoxyribodipyrimidine photo-lyase
VNHLPAHSISRGLVWFRRDLRLNDHAALYHALRTCKQVFCCFVFDTDILEPLRLAGASADRRVHFIHETLRWMNEELATLTQARAQLLVLHGQPLTVLPALAQELGVQAVFTNRDHEPAAIARDVRVRGALAEHGIAFHDEKDQVIFEAGEVQSPAAKPYVVFTPYKNAWLKKLAMRRGDFYLTPYPCEKYFAALAEVPDRTAHPLPSLGELGFAPTHLLQLGIQPGAPGAQTLLDDFLSRMDAYGQTRDFPSVKGPSYLSVHLRFGTVSIRQLAALAYARHMQGSHGASVWLSELIWREFYAQILVHFPHVVHSSFKPAYDAVHWEKGAKAKHLFDAWCTGQTGYPLVDAAMHQLNQTGYMHNRLRMVTASFLTKDLGIDWRWGEQYFALHLNDFDLASNNGGWQWSASTGCDAQPWFRIFNPVTQSERFDPQGKFIRRYLPQLAALDAKAIHAPWLSSSGVLSAAGVTLGGNYPAPLVQHDAARQTTLARYGVLKNQVQT